MARRLDSILDNNLVNLFKLKVMHILHNNILTNFYHNNISLREDLKVRLYTAHNFSYEYIVEVPENMPADTEAQIQDILAKMLQELEDQVRISVLLGEV